jgi:hypothetical protein
VELLKEIEMGDIVMFALLVLAATGAIWSLYVAHKTNGSSHYNRFNLIDLICTKDGRVDRPAFMEIGTWCLMAWGFIVLVTKNQWGLLVAYGGLWTGVFVTRAAHAAWLRSTSKEELPAPPIKD